VQFSSAQPFLEALMWLSPPPKEHELRAQLSVHRPTGSAQAQYDAGCCGWFIAL